MADRLGVHERTVRAWAAAGEFPVIRLPGGHSLRVHRSVVEQIEATFVDHRTISA
jgi:excisionase family DNA binding protein